MANKPSIIDIRKYMERDDSLSPGGGRKCTTSEIRDLKEACTSEEFEQLKQEAFELLNN